MLTEGWDARTVTHVLGVRAFGTQLLSEQVIGRALRRQSYDPNDDGRCFDDDATLELTPDRRSAPARRGPILVAGSRRRRSRWV